MAKTGADKKAAKAERAAVAQDVGAQAGLFGEDGEAMPPAVRAPGRPKGSPNKVNSKLRELMAHRGYRDPVEMLAKVAGLDRPDLHPVAYAAQVAEVLGEDTLDVLRVQAKAASDLLPYYHQKITPDQTKVQIAAQINMDRGAGGKTIEGLAAYAPPPMPGEETEENQDLTDAIDGSSDA